MLGLLPLIVVIYLLFNIIVDFSNKTWTTSLNFFLIALYYN